MKEVQPIPDILRRLMTVLRRPSADAKAQTWPLHEPEMSAAERASVLACLDSGFVSTASPLVAQFEARLAAAAGAAFAIATSSGTAALHLSLLAAGVQPGDEVIVPALTFVATANAVSYCGAVPHFADSSESTLGIAPRLLEQHLRDIAAAAGGICRNRRTGRPIRALLFAHTLGHPGDMDELADLCARFGMTLIEDGAAALGSSYKGKPMGSWGAAAAVSFNGNKIVTTGGGGAVLTNDERLARTVRHLAATAKLPHRFRFVHDRVGYNYRMPGLNAALGIAQLERLPLMLRRKRRLAAAYEAAFRDCAEAAWFKEPPGSASNYWLNALMLKGGAAHSLNELLERTHDEGIRTRPFWTPLHLLPMYAECPRMDLAAAERLARTTIHVPSSASLGGGDDE